MCLILVLFLLALGGKGEPAKEIAPPAPSLIVSFERQNVRENDCVNVELLVTNPSALELAEVSLDAVGPSFLHWYSGRCEAKKDREGTNFSGPNSSPLSLGNVPAQSPMKQELHFHSSDTIEVGEYNVLFIVHYGWKTTRGVSRSVISAEKPVKISFLGNESVAGIPLALAGFIVPGLLFLILLKIFRVSGFLTLLPTK